MNEEKQNKTLGKAIDEIIEALNGLNADVQIAAIKASCDYLKLNCGPSNSIAPPYKPINQEHQPIQNESLPHQIDIRTFKEQKQPSTAVDMTCIVAYYLEQMAPEHERKSEINVDDVEKYFKQANFPLPKAIQQVLQNTRSSGYIDSTPSRGMFKLNPVGYNLVAHSLPRSGQIKTMQKKASSAKPKSRSARGKNK